MNYPVRRGWVDYLPWLVVPGVFLVYTFTRTPAVGLIDSGELAAGCYLLNILHPTGYPLYTLIGRLATVIPAGTVVNRLTVLSAIFSTAGVAFFILLGRRLRFDLALAGVVAGVLGLSLPVWSVSTDVEVYSLTFFLIVLLWWSVSRVDTTNGILFSVYLAGLVLTNHMSGMSAVLGAGVVLFISQKDRLVRCRDTRLQVPASALMPVLLFLFFLGLSPYIFLPLRARCEPLLVWGNPVNLERFWWHITGRQYQVWMFSSSWEAVLNNARRGGLLILGSLGYILAPFVIYGWWRMIKQQRVLTVGLTVSALLAFLYAVNYSIPDIEAYYIPVMVVLALFALAGLDGLISRLGKLRHISWLLVLGVFFFNYPAQNHRDDWIAYDQAMNTLNSCDSNGIVITDWWDCYAPIFYLQWVEGVRRDVCIIDKELLRRSWYFKYLNKAYPWLMARSQCEAEQFLAQLDRFEHSRPYDPQAIQAGYITLLRSFFLNNPERPAYVTFVREGDRDAQELLAGFTLVPMGIVMQVRVDSLVPGFDYQRLNVRVPRRRLDERSRFNLDRYRLFARRRIELLQRQGRIAEAQAVADWFGRTFLSAE